MEEGNLLITSEYEDIHSFVETNLIARIGDAGRSFIQEEAATTRLLLDMKLYVRDEIDAAGSKEVKKLLEALLKIMEENVHTYMPGFTHLQKAQPVTLAHHIGAYFEMFKRDRGRLFDIRKENEHLPSWSGELWQVLRTLLTENIQKLLGFDGPTKNSMDSVSDRDYVVELLSGLFHSYDAFKPFFRRDNSLEFQ